MKRTARWVLLLKWAVRHGPWKLISRYSNKVKTPELYNFEEDLGERHNLAARRPELVEELPARGTEIHASIKP